MVEENEYSPYLALEEADRVGPRRYYTIKLVTHRKNKILGALKHILDTTPDEVRWGVLYANLAKMITPAAKTGSPAHKRRGHKPESTGERTPWHFNHFVGDTCFMTTPEATDPRPDDLIGPIRESFGFRESQTPTPEEIRALAWRLAGNVHKLCQGHAVPPWEPDLQPTEWCLARVVEIADGTTFDGDVGFSMTYFFYTGAAAGLEFTRIFKTGNEARFAHSLGIPWKKCKLIYPQELVNMVGYVQLEPGKSKGRLPIFRQTMVTESHKKHNRWVHERRLDPAGCPFGFKPEPYRMCIDCQLTYDEVNDPETELRCDMAVRRKPDGRKPGSYGTDAAAETAG